MPDQDPDLTRLRSKAMEETGKTCKKQLRLLKTMLRDYRVFKDEDLYSYLFSFLKKKLSSKPLRAHFTTVTFSYLLESYPREAPFPHYSTDLFHVHLPLLFEMVITIQYLDNQILDEKLGVNHKVKGKLYQNLLAGNILRKLIFQYIEEHVQSEIGFEKCQALKTMIRRLFIAVDTGQYIEKQHNTYRCFQADTSQLGKHYLLKGKFKHFPKKPLLATEEFEWMRPLIKKTKLAIGEKMIFTELYFRRIYLTNVLFFLQIVDVVLMLLDIGQSEAEGLRKYAVYYGFLLQVLNDYADFAHAEDEAGRKNLQTIGRKPEDQFSDLRNKNITLPLIFYLSKKLNRQIERYLRNGNKKIVRDFRYEIMMDMLQSGAIDACMDLTIELAGLARQEIDTTHQPGQFLANMTYISEDNKFSKAFEPKS